MEDRGEKIWNLEEYVNAHVPEKFRHWILHQRGYADLFDWTGPDRQRAKREKEQRIVDRWATALYRNDCPFVKIESCEPPLPDCQLFDKLGRKTGVEVTELVDQCTIERNKRSSYHWKEYSPDELISATKAILIEKNLKLQIARPQIDPADFHKIILILHCDEPDLRSRPQFCRDLFGGYQFPTLTEIDEAYLLLPCARKTSLNDFEADYCQIIRIPLGESKRC